MQTETTQEIPALQQSPKRLPESQRSTYQFPVYRWINWLVIAGYGVGLVIMFFLGSLVGLPAAIIWPFFVAVFCAGVALLGRPKALLNCMLFYFLLMPGNRLFGLLPVPLPGFVDELFFLPIIAVIIMNLVQPTRTTHVKGGTWFAPLFLMVAALSWYVNGKLPLFGTVRVSLVMIKFFLVWYYCRLTCVFRNLEEFWVWGKLYIHFAAVQFLYNCLWQGRPWVTRHWDNSGGVFGPEGAGAAHFVGYISVLALFLLAAWWISEGRQSGKRQKAWMLFLGAVITYNLVFMTDTKHALLLMPLAFVPILFHSGIPARLRAGLLVGGSVVTVIAMFYVASYFSMGKLARFGRILANSPKGEAYRAVTTDFHFLVHYPLFGAGPGRFFSQQAIDSGAPLARQYIIPYSNDRRRMMLTHNASGVRTGASLMASPHADFLIVTGEFGWLGELFYLAFMTWVIGSLWRKAGLTRNQQSRYAIVYLAMGSGVLFLNFTTFFAETSTLPSIMFPWWMLVGRLWDMESLEETTVAALPGIPDAEAASDKVVAR